MIIAFEPVSYSFSLTWDTQIIKASDGTEQRMAVGGPPRLDINAQFLLDLDDLREVRSMLFREPDAVHEMVLWHEETQVIGSTGADNIVIPQVAADCLAAEDRRLILRVAGEDDHVATVTAVANVGDDYQLTLDPAPAAVYRAAPTRVLPLYEVYLRDNQTTSRWRLNEVGRWAMSAVGKTFFTGAGTGSIDIPTFDGHLMLDVPSSIGEKDTLTEQHQAMIEGLGSDVGPAVPVTQMAFGDIAREAKFAWHSDEDRQFWKNFLYTVEGRRRPVLTPTWRPDLELAAPTAATGDEILVLDTPDLRDWWTADSHKRLAFMFSDGTFEAGKVVAIDDNLDGTLTLTLDDPLTSGDDIEFISFLETVRLANDRVEVEYAAGQGRFDLPLVVVQDLTT